MQNKYNKIISLSMICLTAIVALFYCLLQYRNFPIVIALISLSFIASVYLLLREFVSLSVEKREALNVYITEQISSTLSNITKTNEDIYKLYKASYVQTRKHNELLSALSEQINLLDNSEAIISSVNEVISGSINKSTKVIIKYNDANTNKLVSNSNKLLTETKEGTAKLIYELQNLKPSSMDNNTILPITNELSTFRNQLDSKMNEITSGLNDISSSIQAINLVNTYNPDTARNAASFSSSIIEELENLSRINSTSDNGIEIINNTDNNISNGTIDSSVNDLGFDVYSIAEIDDPKEDTSFKENLIEDNLFEYNSLENDLSEDELSEEHSTDYSSLSTDKVIPFPTEPVVEEDFDPNKPLSPEDIAKLFASMSGGSEPEPITTEPVIEDVVVPSVEVPAAPVDPNKPLSPEEIAALFASMS